MRLISAICLVIAPLLLAAPPKAQPPGEPEIGIEEIRDGLYKVTTGPRVSPVFVFLVTDEGIVVVDPPNPAATTIVRDEIEARFPGVPVRYVIESHYHWDHVGGSRLFADTAEFIAHENMALRLAGTLSESPPPGNTRDNDGDNRLSREEALTGTRANFDRFDTNRDDYLTPAELTAEIEPPTILFADSMEIELGGKHVRLLWAQNRHTDDLIDIYFPDHRVLFASDYIWINRMCCGFAYDERPMSLWIESIRDLEQLDFEILINSHFESGTKADLVAFRVWLETLEAAVSDAIDEGLTLEEMQAQLEFDEYSDWAGYPEQLPTMIESAWLSLTQHSP
jgi:glyoxylase-like metal-dependent hydrolase (beta-lactamase superfamily II)